MGEAAGVFGKMGRRLRRAARALLGGSESRTPAPAGSVFRAEAHLRHNMRRLEHLASLGLELHGRTVLEVGAGIGDHTHFFLDRGCSVTATDARPEHLDALRRRYPAAEVRPLDLERPPASWPARHEIVYCYGVLYHLGDPAGALRFLAGCCDDLLLLETAVSADPEPAVVEVEEPAEIPTMAASGRGCRPSRSWVFRELGRHFERVYVPRTQPSHEDFLLDWNAVDASYPPPGRKWPRAVFVASRRPLRNERLAEELISRQTPA